MMSPSERVRRWRRDGLLYLGTDKQDGSPLYLSKQTLSVSHVHGIGAIGSGKTQGVYQLCWPLLLDPSASFVVLDGKPGGGEISTMFRDFAIAYGQSHRLDLLDFSNQDIVTGYAPMAPNGLIPTAHAKKVRQVFRVGVAGASSFDQTRQMAKLTYIALYTARLFELDLTDAWELLHPQSRLRSSLLPKIPDPFLKRELEYIHRLKPDRFDVLVSPSLALIEQVLMDSYLRAYLTHRPSLNIRESLRNRRILLVNLGHESPLSSDDVRILGRMILNDIVTSVFANRGQYGHCYLVLDEAHLTLSRDICLAADTGRSMLLRMFALHQHLDQLRDEETSGWLYGSVMSSFRTKFVFGGCSTADLRILEDETRIGEVDIYKRKHTLYSLETHQRESQRTTRSSSYTYSRGQGLSLPESTTETTSQSTSLGTSTSITAGFQESRSRAFARGRSRGTTHATGEAVSDLDSWSESDADGESWNDSDSTGASWASSSALSLGQSASIGQGAVMDPDGEELTTTMNEAAGSSMAFVSGMSAGGSEVHAHGTGGSRMHASTRGGAHGITRSTSVSTSEAESESVATGESAGRSMAYQQGTSEARTTGTSTAVTRGSTPSFSENESWSTSESVVPFMEVEQRLRPSSIEYVSREEQAIGHIQQMKFIPTGDCMASVPMNPVASFFSFDWIKPLRLSPDVRDRNLQDEVYAKPIHSPRALPGPCDAHEPARRAPLRIIAAETQPAARPAQDVLQPSLIPDVLPPKAPDDGDDFWQ
jgi:hypothetical protein